MNLFLRILIHKATHIFTAVLLLIIPLQTALPDTSDKWEYFRKEIDEDRLSKEQCNGDYKNKILSQDDVNEILINREELINERLYNNVNDLSGIVIANLCMANLSNLDLSNSDLDKANLSYSILEGANISNTSLLGANLSHSVLLNTTIENTDFINTILQGALLADLSLVNSQIRYSNFIGARFYNVDFTGSTIVQASFNEAEFSDVNFSGTNIHDSDFKNAYFFDVNLTNAILQEVTLENASIFTANLDGTQYEPELDSLPKLAGLAYSYNLEKISYSYNPAPLNELVHAFRSAGLDDAARGVVYALKRINNNSNYLLFSDNEYTLQTRLFSGVNYGINYLLYYWSTRWGSQPLLAITRLVNLIFLFAIFYVVVLIKESKKGIWKIYPEPQLGEGNQGKQPTLLKLKWYDAISIGVYFSILSHCCPVNFHSNAI